MVRYVFEFILMFALAESDSQTEKFATDLRQYKLLCTISNNSKVYEESVPWTKKTRHYAFKIEVHEENRIVYESLYG